MLRVKCCKAKFNYTGIWVIRKDEIFYSVNACQLSQLHQLHIGCLNLVRGFGCKQKANANLE
jgi:hypothetical protein